MMIEQSSLSLPRLAFKVSEAAVVVGISQSALFEDIAAGLLKSKKRGRSTLILVDDLTAYLRALPNGGRAG